MVVTVTDITTAKVRTMVDSVDDPLSDAAVEGPEANAIVLILHLIFIFSSFELLALVRSISILADTHHRHRHKNQIGELLEFIARHSLTISNPLDFLDIDIGCVPVSVDAAARQLSWPNWVVLLPEIPSNRRFKILGANV